jgi:hypothetical protein
LFGVSDFDQTWHGRVGQDINDIKLWHCGELV